MSKGKGPQPTRYAVQKARGKGWKTLEVGEDLAHAEARFDLMVDVNPRAYFRLVELEYNDQSDYEGMEFNWKLIHLYDPTTGARRTGAAIRSAAAIAASIAQAKAGGGADRKRGGRRNAKAAEEKLRLPIRFYIGVMVVGALAGLLVYLRFGLTSQ